MRLLLDTHVFLWYITGDANLSDSHKNAIQDPANEVYLSVASVWEAVIKHQIGKLSLPADPATFIPQQRDAHSIAPLPIAETAMPHLAALPMLHRDPFDRMIVAQALELGLTLVTVDPAVLAYSVPSL